MLSKKTDLPALWKEVYAGSHQSYAVLHYQLYPGLFAYVSRMIKDNEIANDLLQDMFVKLWVKKEIIGEISNVKAYFFTAARSVTLNYIKRMKTQDKYLEETIFADLEFSAEEIITERETNLSIKRTISSALDRLPIRQREIVYLRFYEDMDYNQIVEVTGIKYQSVINHIYRAVQTLREDFKYTNELNVA